MTPEARKVEALLAMGRADDAVALAASLPEREAPTAEFLRLRGRAMRAAGRVFDAEASFREALELTPGEPGLLADLATTLLGQRRHREALGFAREAVALRPDVAAYHALSGVLAEGLQLDDEAERELAAARALAPNDAEAHTVYGFHALRCGRYTAAEQSFLDAVRVSPNRAEALRGLARARLAADDVEGARTAWLDALRVDPSQRDSELARIVVLGHPGLAPIRAVMRVPMWVSAALAALGLGVVSQLPSAALFLLALSAAGPAARIWGKSAWTL